jgi:hypothetical protein
MEKVVLNKCKKMLINLKSEIYLIFPRVYFFPTDTHNAQTSSEYASGVNGTSPPLPADIQNYIELFCNDQLLDATMDLRTVKHFYWKQAADVLIHFNQIKFV